MNPDAREARIAEVPSAYPKSFTRLKASLVRWLDRHENHHLTPVDTSTVVMRPMTRAEREARNRRLALQKASGVRRESGFRLVPKTSKTASAS